MLKTLKWLATEHHYFRKLKEDLKDLKKDIANAKQKSEVKDIKHVLRDFKFIGLAERKFEKFHQAIDESIEKTGKNILT